MGQRSLAGASQANTVLVKVTQGPHKGESFNITKAIFTIGRNADNDIVLPNDSKISRTHVSVSKKGNSYVVENLSVRNPIFQNQQQKSKIEIHSRQPFQIGESELEFIWDSPVSTHNQAQAQSTLQPQPHPPPQSPTPAPKQILPLTNLVIPKNSPNAPALVTNKKPNLVLGNNYDQLNNSNTKKRRHKAKPKNNSFLIIIVVIVALVLFMIPDKNSSKKLKKSNLRSSEEIQKALQASKISVENYQKEKRIQQDGTIDKQFESSQSYYIRGFRDYRQGQYSRAIQAFQAALSFDPNHILSRKYLNLSLKKLDELVQFNMNQGRRYREKSNYRLCKSAFQQVMVIKKDPNESVYKEAKQLFDECDTLHRGRY